MFKKISPFFKPTRREDEKASKKSKTFVDERNFNLDHYKRW